MAQGRRCDLKKETFWRRMVRGHSRSGLSIRGWCRRHDVKEPAFHWWRRELARRDARSPILVPVQAAPPADSGDADGTQVSVGQIEIVLANQRRVRICGRVERQVLVDVLTVLGVEELSHAETAQPG